MSAYDPKQTSDQKDSRRDAQSIPSAPTSDDESLQMAEERTQRRLAAILAVAMVRRRQTQLVYQEAVQANRRVNNESEPLIKLP